MNSYIALLGHQPKITVAELRAAFPDIEKVEPAGKLLVRFSTQAAITQALFDRLGGTALIARRITTGGAALENIPQILANEISGINGKVTFSIRNYGMPKTVIRDLYRDCKDHLKKHGRPSRYVGTERRPTAAILLKKMGLLDGSGGCELFLMSDGDELWIGRTVGAQDVEEYTRRDIGKPARDMTVGILPPKLAQVMLNFGQWMMNSDGLRVTGSEKTKKLSDNPQLVTRHPQPVIYDPFCGTGVLPMECLLRGWGVLASDASLKAVNACEKNLEWLRKEKKIAKKDVPSTVWKQDARKPVESKVKPSCVVTETTLGPGLKKFATLKEAQSMKSESEKTQAEFLKNIAASLPGVPVVCTWPVWRTSKGLVLLEKVWDALHAAGYRAILPPGTEPDVPGRVSMLYGRPDQFVLREIVLLQPKKRT